uniref:FMRFamide-related neuropeptides n=1 Tax=Caenorhabditis tropicalis TaxID=1561998 RepID=A0A1I7TRC5_9PELO
MSSRSTIAFLFIATLLAFQCVSAQSSEEDAEYLDKYQRIARAPKPKFIRFGRAGAKFIRFGRAGANTWEDGYAQPSVNDLYVKRGAKFIRFG